VKPETGYLFMSTIAKTPESYFLAILSKFFLLLSSFVVAEYLLKLMPKGTHEWDKFINVEDLERMIS